MSNSDETPDLGKIRWDASEVSEMRLYMLRVLWRSGQKVDENTPFNEVKELCKATPGAFEGEYVLVDEKEMLKCLDDIFSAGIIKVDPQDFRTYSEYRESYGKLSINEFDDQQREGGAGEIIGWRRDRSLEMPAQHYFITSCNGRVHSLCGKVFGIAKDFVEDGIMRVSKCKICERGQRGE